MSPWTIISSNPRVYRRPLGANELGFYWDSCFDGTADTSQICSVECFSDSLRQKDVVEDAWNTLKQYFPLLGAQITTEGDLASFDISEKRLRTCNPLEVTFPPGDLESLVNLIQTGDRQLSDTLLARVFILSNPSQPRHFHILITIAHLISDGMSNTSLMRNFLNLLGGASMQVPSLDTRLALAVSTQDLAPSLRLPLARQRWRWAVAAVISGIRQRKYSGGHTLPRTITDQTFQTPAHTHRLLLTFSPNETQRILNTCRKHGFTFGNAFPIIGQIAVTRVLCRQRVLGLMDDEEWDFRRKEPMYSAGPLNLRPFLDQDWYRAGGHDAVLLAIGFYVFRLLHMSLGKAGSLRKGDPVPSFRDLLPRNRFIYRSRLVRRQSDLVIKHPLSLDIGQASLQRRIESSEAMVRAWQQRSISDANASVGIRVSPMDQILRGPVAAHGGSSFGAVDALFPAAYPTSLDGSPPPDHTITVHGGSTLLRCRPAELYLGASTSRGQLRLVVFTDLNVYSKAIVDEWLEEVRLAIITYLGGEDVSKL